MASFLRETSPQYYILASAVSGNSTICILKAVPESVGPAKLWELIRNGVTGDRAYPREFSVGITL